VITAGATFLPILLPWSIDTAPLMAVIMFGGTLVRRHNSLSKQRWEWIFFLPYLLLLPFCNNINISVRMYGFSMITYTLAALSGCIILVWISLRLQGTIVGKVLQQIGIHSLTIFCIEIPFILVGKQFSDFILPEMSSIQIAIITSIIQLITALGGGYLLSIILHKNNYIRKIIF